MDGRTDTLTPWAPVGVKKKRLGLQGCPQVRLQGGHQGVLQGI